MRLAAAGGRVSLTRPGMGWLPWATHRYQAPQAFVIPDSGQGNRATLYASAGAAMMLRAEDVPLPFIWCAPTPHLALITATWQVIHWTGANAAPLSVDLGLLLAIFTRYVYAGMARPNKLSPRIVR